MTNYQSSLVKEIGRGALSDLDDLGLTADTETIADIVDIIGVLSGIKPAAFIGGTEKGAIGSNLLTRLGLVYTTSAIKNIVYISREPALARRLVA